MTDKVIVFSTCASREEGKRIARVLVEERLAACVNVIDGIVSIYQWQGKVHEGDEVMLVVKSRRDLLSRIDGSSRKRVKEKPPEGGFRIQLCLPVRRPSPAETCGDKP